MSDFELFNGRLRVAARSVDGIIGDVHTKVPGAEHIKRIIPIPADAAIDVYAAAAGHLLTFETLGRWCLDHLAQELRGRVGFIRRIEIKEMREVIPLSRLNGIALREGVAYDVGVTYPALVYRLFVLPGEAATEPADTPEGTVKELFVLATDHAEEALLDNAPGVESITAKWRCQCLMCDFHRTAAAMINAEGQGINAAPAPLLTVENAMRLRGQIQERQG